MKEDLPMRHYLILLALLTVGLTSCKYNKSPPVSIESEDKSLVNQWFGPNHFEKVCTKEDSEKEFYSPVGYTTNEDEKTQTNQNPSNCECPQNNPKTPLRSSLDSEKQETPDLLNSDGPFDSFLPPVIKNSQIPQKTPGGAI
jgi:hypothetical protein